MSIIQKIAAGLPRFLDRRFAGHRDPLVAGDRLAAAKVMWPEGQWPTLYRDIPADIRRPVVWDGRLYGGTSVTWLAWRHFSPALLVELAERSGYAARRASLIMFAGMIALIVYSMWSYGGGVEYPAWAERIGATMPIVTYYIRETLSILASATNSVVYAALAALLAFPAFWVFGFWRSLKAWWHTASEPLTTPTRDALLIWKSRADIRPAEYRAYCRQVEDASTRLAGMPLIAVGKATGTLRARGDMESPTAGQTVAFDGESIRQHVLILGGTGVGKTRLAVRPLFERIMGADWGQGHRTGAYVTDGKGTLWRDVLPALEGRDDVAIVGTGPGHFGVDLLAGMTPLEVASTFKAVSGQVAGRPSDDFWPESASGRLMHAAAIALVIENDPESRAAWDNLRPYSLMGIAKLAADDEAQRAACERVRVLAGMDKADRPATVAPFLAEAVESTEWVEGTWFPMAQETRSGIVANINVVLGKLGGAGPLADRFFRGTCDLTVDVDHALNGGVMMIAVGETEWGLAGKVVNVWLKTRLYVAARKRLVTDPEACRRTSCALFADEFQMLVTAGPDSDSTFWNVARETGVFLIAATQSIAALHQVLGSDQTANVVNLLRSKIILKTEESSTLDYIRKLAGESPRGWESEPEFFSSQGARELAFPDRTPEAPRVSALSTILPAWPRLTTASMKQAVAQDLRFLLSGGGQQAAAQRISAEQQAAWRAEDRAKDTLTSGLQWRPKVESDELLLGSGYAFAIVQRAGGDRSDIIDLAA